jgi:F-type H+-transporting ATPase subunit b
MQIISNIALISINETLFVQLISFLIFLFVINRIMFRPLKSSMKERDEYIEGLDHGIRDTQKEMEEILKTLKKKEKAARDEAHGMRLGLEEEGSRKSTEIHDNFMKSVAELRQETEADVARQIEEARKHLQKESEVLAVNIMEKVLNRRLAS